MARKILFVPWPRSLGNTAEPYTVFSNNLYINSKGIVKLKNPERPMTNAGLEYTRTKNEPWIQHERNKGHECYEVVYDGRINIIMLSLNAVDDDIYIRGHSLPGNPYIFSDGNLHHDAQLTAPTVAERLIASGLQRNFPGNIKCYNCHSATSSDTSASFGQRLTNFMHGFGYDQCRYFGYMGAISSYPGAEHGPHKYSTAGGRASDQRVELFPQ